MLYRDGVPLALLVGSEVQFLDTLPPAEEWPARKSPLARGNCDRRGFSVGKLEKLRFGHIGEGSLAREGLK